MKLKNRINECKMNKQGVLMTIIKYNNARDIDVLFESGGIRRNVCYRYFEMGTLEDFNFLTVYNKGYIGYGKYKPRCKATGKFISQYVTWFSMLNRCYSTKTHNRENTYDGCSVCEEWLNFQNFAKWYDENYYKLGNETMCLDKDIILKGNKTYSPNTCCFVPTSINNIFTKNNINRGSLLIGVTKYGSYYKTQIKTKGEDEWVYHIATEIEAFNIYKEYKEKHIKYIADQYRNKYENFPIKLYNALYNYKVEITD